MYGMIHKGARYAVIKIYGEPVWERALSTSQLTEAHFISAAHYDDVATYSLVEAISLECNITIKEVLHAAGRYWIEYATQTGYESILNLTGRTLPEFLGNLDRMHASLKRTLPEAVLPSFELVSSTPDKLEVIYRSHRDGFEPFVSGILEGVLEHFNEPMKMSYKVKESGTRFILKREQVSRSAHSLGGPLLQMAK